MDFVIDSIEVIENINNLPIKVSSTFKDVFEASKNLRYTKDNYDRSHWQVRQIGVSEEYNRAINDIAQIACARIPINGQLTPQILLENIANDREAFDRIQSVASSEVSIMLNEIAKNNRDTQEILERYNQIGLIDDDTYQRLLSDCDGYSKAMVAESPIFVINLINDVNGITVKMIITDANVNLNKFRIGRYLTDLIRRKGGECYDIPEEVRFKKIQSLIGLGVDINLDYLGENLQNVYMLKYRKDGSFEKMTQGDDK